MKFLSKSKSIREKMRLSLIITISLLSIPSLLGISTMYHFSGRYNSLIANLALANGTMIGVKTSIYNEMWSIVSGRQGLDESRTEEILIELDRSISYLKDNSSSADNYTLMEVIERTRHTLDTYIGDLEKRIREKGSVDGNMVILEEIRGVSELLFDLFQEYATGEITSIAEIAKSMSRFIRMIILIALGIVFFLSLLTVRMVNDVTKDIRSPLLDLEKMSLRIANGDLKVQATEPDLNELKGLTSSLNRMARHLEGLMAEGIRREQKLLKTEMRALQAQIAPHFLYNTLDTIIGLAEADRNQEVVEITQSIARFFRVSLSKGNDFIPIERELTHVKSYLEIQKIRYCDIMDYEINVEEEIMNKPILKLLLQPLVENALYHGIKPSRKRGKIIIEGKRADGWIEFSVRDDGVGISFEKLKKVRESLSGRGDKGNHGGFGIYNVNERIKLYYNILSGLEIQSKAERGTCISFKLPDEGNVND